MEPNEPDAEYFLQPLIDAVDRKNAEIERLPAALNSALKPPYSGQPADAEVIIERALGLET